MKIPLVSQPSGPHGQGRGKLVKTGKDAPVSR